MEKFHPYWGYVSSRLLALDIFEFYALFFCYRESALFFTLFGKMCEHLFNTRPLLSPFIFLTLAVANIT